MLRGHSPDERSEARSRFRGMCMSDIADLLTTPEGRTLEFKRDLSSLGPVLRTLVGMSPVRFRPRRLRSAIRSSRSGISQRSPSFCSRQKGYSAAPPRQDRRLLC